MTAPGSEFTGSETQNTGAHTKGKRDAYLEELSAKAEALGKTNLNLNVYDSAGRGHPILPEHPILAEIRALLAERLPVRAKIDWGRDKEYVLGLYHGDPSTFSDTDFEVLVRAIWKSDRVGLYLGGNEVFRNGLMPKIIKHWDAPSSCGKTPALTSA